MNEPSVSRHAGAWLTLTVIVLLVILAAIAYFVPFRGDTLWHRAVAAHELRGIYVSKGNSEPVVPDAFGIFGLTLHTVKGATGILGDFAEVGSTRVAITRAQAGATAQVQELAPKQQALSTGPGAKAIVAVSPDGAWAAYSVASSSNTFSTRLSSWSIQLVSLADGTTLPLGPGFGPQFFERAGKTWLLYTSTAGITVFDIAGRKSFTTPIAFPDDVTFMIKVSSDGAHMGLRDPVAKNFGLYSITRVSTDLPLGYTPSNPGIEADDLTLTPSAVYTIIPSSYGVSYVRKTAYTEGTSSGQLLYTIPGTGYRLIP